MILGGIEGKEKRGQRTDGNVVSGKMWKRWDGKVKLPITKDSDEVAWYSFLQWRVGMGTGGMV